MDKDLKEFSKSQTTMTSLILSQVHKDRGQVSHCLTYHRIIRESPKMGTLGVFLRSQIMEMLYTKLRLLLK